MTPVVRADETSVRAALQAAMAHHEAGRFGEAEAIYRRVLEAAPERPEALALLADLAQRRGAEEEAMALLRRAVAAAPSAANLHHQLAILLYRAGRVEEAIAHLRRAVALRPDLAAAHADLGLVLEALGRTDEALPAFRAALELADTPPNRAHFARALIFAPRLPADAGLREQVARALSECWARPADLARPAIALLLGDASLRERIDAAGRAPTETTRALFGREAFTALSAHRLLLALLETAQVCERRLEGFLTAARREWLGAALADRLPQEALAFGCALARQCRLNDYVFAETADERATAGALARTIEAALGASTRPDPARLAAVASYLPLASLAGAERLLAHAWPAPVQALLREQLEEPREEREDRARIAVLTPIRDAVSRDVRRQYEENPYPRWTGLPACEPLPFERYLGLIFPHVALDFSRLARPIELLVAGCGTGQESADLARELPEARVLGVDLSVASLGYARRKARGLGIANVEYAQADLLELASLGRTFDVISSVGVLHHLGDPLAGWRALVACLRPGGFMQVGLYSELARRDIVAARSFVAERGLAPTPEGIRAAREALFADPRFARVTALRDFYGMNECRDLVFHVQEHRFTFPRLAEALAQLRLELVGLRVDGATRRRYAERFPADTAQCDLAGWDAFEREFPDTFAGMYLFWVRKPAGT